LTTVTVIARFPLEAGGLTVACSSYGIDSRGLWDGPWPAGSGPVGGRTRALPTTHNLSVVPDPLNGGAARLAYSLPKAVPARPTVLDTSGRVIIALDLSVVMHCRCEPDRKRTSVALNAIASFPHEAGDRRAACPTNACRATKTKVLPFPSACLREVGRSLPDRRLPVSSRYEGASLMSEGCTSTFGKERWTWMAPS
jgi:hypothetical protein